jgi:hypothetical protein
MPLKTDSQLTGAAGEHLVLSRLLSRGMLAAQAPRGTRKADILVNFLDGGRPCLIQAKSRQYGSDGGWHMQEKHESQIEEDLYFCFVDFQPEEPVVFVIPSEVVAEAVATDYKIWLETPGMKGQARNETKLRRLKPVMLGKPEGWLDQYRERWDLIQMREGVQA